ncbi:MAG: valine--tRNA ligase [Candidatus Neomarinimicrobiota bacterium]
MTDFQQLSKIYDPVDVESRWYGVWMEKNYFHASVSEEKTPHTIVIPPPNITGSLTVGHVLNNTIQDALIRRARMRGKEACWIPGTDHASIATETKLVKILAKEGIEKQKLGRENFLKRTWDWKEEYGSLITEQLKRLGCSCDWQRERFTMDDSYSRAVIHAFVTLYKKGYIYRGKRLVNWCPKTESAISDEEVIYKEVDGHLWYFKYPVKNSDEYVTVATTRPETMLGDTAIAVHPGDDRFRHLVGKTVILPLVGREMPVIEDSYVDPEFGTGCIKVTPAHDPNDFKMGRTHNLEMVNILDEKGAINENAPEEFQGLDRFVARDRVVERMSEQGLVEKVEDYHTSIGYSDRGNVPIEPYLSEQWFMRMSELAKPAIDAVREGKIKFHPHHWVKTYEHWMENIHDWCISRQLWWGHRIPVWYHRQTDEIYCGANPPQDSENWDQDPDVLDTWASSWLWPLGVLGWPEETDDLRYFHPTADLVTGGDIIFFWVARMIMASFEFVGEVPFRNVYFNGMVRDVQGRKMSKSLGNSPDPLAIIDSYGADALRFGIMLIAPQGLDILFSEQRIEVGRNFMNKLWNASRFVLMATEDVEAKPLTQLDQAKLDPADRWILSRLNRTVSFVNTAFSSYRFNEIAKRIYDFTWSDFCDWYVEIIKSRLYGDDEETKSMALSVAVHVVRNILKLLHPFAPFITEEIWQKLNTAAPLLDEGTDLIVSAWPSEDDTLVSEDVESELKLLQDVVTGIRTIRAEMNVPPGKRADLLVRSDNGEFMKTHAQVLRHLAKIDNLTVDPALDRPPHSATVVIGNMELFVPLKGLIDVEKEKKRLADKIENLESRLDTVRGKLQNEDFVHKAPDEIVEKEKKKLGDMSDSLKKLKRNYLVLK